MEPSNYGILFTVPKGKDRVEFRKEAMLGFIVKLNEAGGDGEGKPIDPEAPYAVITMDCGEEKTYRRIEDIPTEDVPCPCGNPNHWIVKWVEGD